MPGGITYCMRQNFIFKITRDAHGEAGFKCWPRSGCIAQVEEGGAAARAGMGPQHLGGWITHVDGQPVMSKFSVSNILLKANRRGLGYRSAPDGDYLGKEMTAP